MLKRLQAPVRTSHCAPRFVVMDKFDWTGAADLSDEAGVTAIEYGLLAALIVVAILGGVSLVGDRVFGMFDSWTKAVILVINP